jgi:hypothetical protein
MIELVTVNASRSAHPVDGSFLGDQVMRPVIMMV